MARICRHSAILVRPHARTLLHDLRVYQLAPKADEHGFGFPRLLALSCRAPMARPSPLWARGFGSGAVRPCYPLGWPRRQCGGAYTVPGNKLVRESAGGHNLRGARASLLTCQLYGASLEPRPAASLRTGLFFIVLRGITSLISDSQSERLDEYPEVKAKLTAQLRENHEQLKRLEQCLEGCGESTKQCRLGAVGGKPVRL
jgi:hypothetical protein